MNYTFWLQHADAVGVAVVTIGLAAIGWLWLDHLHRRALRAQRRAFRSELDTVVRSYRARLEALNKLLGHATQRRPSSFDDAATQAVALAGPIRTPLTDALALEQTIADVPSPYAPVWGEA